jgi:nucleotide-binding universal stress UspA family protein
MNVLVAIDDSDLSKHLIEEIATRQWPGDYFFLVFHVVAMPSSEYWQDWGFSVWPDLKEKLLTEADKLVQKNVAYLNEKLEPKTPVEGSVAEGHVCDSIIKLATEWPADLIMLGSHGRTGIEKFFLGSVAEGVLLQAPCSIEIIKLKKEHSKFESVVRSAG